MAIIKQFNQYIQEIVNEIPGVNRGLVVIDPSHLSKYLTEFDSAFNSTLFAVLPTFGNNSPASTDEHRNRAFTEFMVVDKKDLSDFSQETMIDFYDQMYEKVSAIQEKMKADHESGECTLLKHLNASSMQIVEVYNLAGSICGWNLIFTFDE